MKTTEVLRLFWVFCCGSGAVVHLWVPSSGTETGSQKTCRKLLEGRLLKLLKSVVNGDGFRVWRQLTEELQPASRPRALALAMVSPLKEGGSVYTLLYEQRRTKRCYEPSR